VAAAVILAMVQKSCTTRLRQFATRVRQTGISRLRSERSAAMPDSGMRIQIKTAVRKRKQEFFSPFSFVWTIQDSEQIAVGVFAWQKAISCLKTAV
jgi:hypothetical protein